MCPTFACLVLAFVGAGSDYGWRPTPDGKALELIVQIDPMIYDTLKSGDPISVAFPPGIQQYRVSTVTVAVGKGPPPRDLPREALRDMQPASNHDASAAPATAPYVAASPLPSSRVVPANATAPLGSNGPALEPGGQGTVRVGPPTGPSAAPRTTNEQTQGAADPRAGSTLAPGQGNANFNGMEPVGEKSPGGFNVKELMLYLAIIGLAASNGYVGWLWYDARQRYIGLLARKFATAS
jgi:hypothetical protein